MRGPNYPSYQSSANNNNWQHYQADLNQNGYQQYNGYNSSLQAQYNGYENNYASNSSLQNSHNTSNNDFSEYAWMVDQDEIEKKMMEELEQEDYIEACLEQLWMDELEDEINNLQKNDEKDTTPTSSLERLTINDTPSVMTVPRITLNPNAQEFIPRSKVITA